MRLKRLKPALKGLNCKHYSNISMRVMQAKGELSEVQKAIQQGNVSTEIRQREMQCKLTYASLCKDEEAFYN